MRVYTIMELYVLIKSSEARLQKLKEVNAPEKIIRAEQAILFERKKLWEGNIKYNEVH